MRWFASLAGVGEEAGSVPVAVTKLEGGVTTAGIEVGLMGFNSEKTEQPAMTSVITRTAAAA
jgi:hypothetical protein